MSCRKAFMLSPQNIYLSLYTVNNYSLGGLQFGELAMKSVGQKKVGQIHPEL